MKTSNKKLKRVLAIDPSTRGFGFAVLEGPERLIDWGVKEVHGDKNPQSLKAIQRLLDCYQPNVVIVEDCDAKGSLRRMRPRNLIQKTLALSAKKQIRTRSISRLQIRRAFMAYGARNKHQIATAIVQHFPELLPWLPPPRKPWMSEDYRMSIFGAMALVLTFLFLLDKRKC